MYKLHHVNFYNISSQIDQYIVKTSSARAYQGPKRQVSRKILISLWAMSTLVPFKLSQSVTYRDVFYIIFSGRKCDYTVCCNSLVRGVATADGNRVAGRLYCHVRKFLAASNFRRLSTKFCWNQNLGGCRYALLLESVCSFSWTDDTKCARVKFHPVTCWFISWFLITFSHVSLFRFSHSNHHRLPPLLHISSLRLRRIPYNIVRLCGLNVVFSLHVNPQVRTVCGMPLSGHCSLANL